MALCQKPCLRAQTCGGLPWDGHGEPALYLEHWWCKAEAMCQEPCCAHRPMVTLPWGTCTCSGYRCGAMHGLWHKVKPTPGQANS
eukprot:scaffold35614_cov22-Tisochrysis_lutea.AAC.1